MSIMVDAGLWGFETEGGYVVKWKTLMLCKNPGVIQECGPLVVHTPGSRGIEIPQDLQRLTINQFSGLGLVVLLGPP